jgi:hypothetical protein
VVDLRVDLLAGGHQSVEQVIVLAADVEKVGRRSADDVPLRCCNTRRLRIGNMAGPPCRGSHRLLV